MPPIPAKKSSEAVSCGINKYVDVCVGTGHGPWRGTEKQAKADKKNVEHSAENDAWIKAQQEAVDVAERTCPSKCKHKSSEDDPDPVQPWYRPAEVVDSAPESELGKGWRWFARAKVEYQVLFACDGGG
jgi:hypothetical protein